MKSQQKQRQEELTLPEWLDHLLRENFFTPCSFHYNIRKNEKNVFCVDCLHALCSQCVLLSHSSHRLLQVRRYVYHDVVRLEDAEMLIDCSHVQPYISNGLKVVFLNQRPTNRLNSHSGNICGACDRILQDPFLYCCISCKVDYVLEKGGLEALHGYIRSGDSLQLNNVVLEVDVVNGLMTPDSVLEPSWPVSVRSSSSSSGAATANAVDSSTAGVSTATTTTGSGQAQRLFPRKKRTPKFPVDWVVPVSSAGSGGRPGCCVKQNGNRRKRVPCRSALA